MYVANQKSVSQLVRLGRGGRFASLSRRSPAVLLIVSVFICSVAANLCAEEPALSLGEYLRTHSAVSETEAMAITNRFVQATNEGDVETCGRLFDVSGMIDRQNKDLDVPADFRDSFVAGVKESWESFPDLVKSGGDYTVLRAVQRDGGTRVIVRMLQPQYKINYHELMFDRDERGFARISDIYIMAMGESINSIFRRMLLAGYADEQSPLLARVFSNHANAVELGQSLQKIPTLVKTDPKQALKTIASLPAELRNEKWMLILRLNTAATLDETEYDAAYQAFVNAFPGDSSLDLQSVFYHFARGEFLASIAAAQRLKQAVGGDPKLDEMIAMINSATMKAALNYQIPENKEPSNVLRRFSAHPKTFSVREWTGTVSEIAIQGDQGPSGRVARFRVNRFPGVEVYIDSFDSQANAEAALEHIDADPLHCLMLPDSAEETTFTNYRDVRDDNDKLGEYQCGTRRGLFAGAVVPVAIPVVISVRITRDGREDSIDPLVAIVNMRDVYDKMAAEAKSIQRILHELGL